MEEEIQKLFEELKIEIGAYKLSLNPPSAIQISVKFAIQKQIDVLFKVDETMANLMIDHGRDISVDRETSMQLWMETAWCKVLRAEINKLKELKERL